MKGQNKQDRMARTVRLVLTFILMVAILSPAIRFAYQATTTVPEDSVTSGEATEIQVDLIQTTPDSGYLMIPGVPVAQDMQVSIGENTGSGYVYVRVTEENNEAGYLSYALADGWTLLECSDDNVYYRAISGTEATAWYVLKDQQVTVNPETMPAL